MDEPRFNIRAVERLTGVPAATLRSWERRYGFPVPSRTATARRLYTEREVQQIRWVKGQTEEGLTVAQAIRWAQEGVAADRSTAPSVSTPPPAAAGPSLAIAFVDAVARYDDAAADGVLSSAFARHPADVVLTDVVTPALMEVGERWARGELAVSAEHFASHILHRRLSTLLAEQPAVGTLATVIAACVPGEQHEIGLLMLSLFLRWAGARVVYLGADVPVPDLIRCTADVAAAALCLSAFHPSSAVSLQETVVRLRDAGVQLPIFAGGPAAVRAQLPADVTVPSGGPRAAAEQVVAATRAA